MGTLAEKPFQDALIRYLGNAAGRYNQVKTMATEPVLVNFRPRTARRQLDA